MKIRRKNPRHGECGVLRVVRYHFKHTVLFLSVILDKRHCACLCRTDTTRILDRDRFDTLSIPNYVIKKGASHGARHRKTEEQRIYHIAYNAWKTCRQKGEYNGKLDRVLNSPRYRASQTAHGWTEELCAKYDACVQEDHSNTDTAWVHQRLASNWKIQLNGSGPSGPIAKRPDYQEAVRIKNRLHQESGEADKKERTHPGEQGQTNPHNQFSTTCQDSSRVDPKNGKEVALINPLLHGIFFFVLTRFSNLVSIASVERIIFFRKKIVGLVYSR